ncbi:MAG: Maf family protein [Polyangiaceae bacterium]
MRITRNYPLILGSASPRRRELLARLGVPFLVRPANADEVLLPGEAPSPYLERVVTAKLAAVRAAEPSHATAILVADTIVVAPNGDLLGKPRDDAAARAMIECLAGATHEVKTRFGLFGSEGEAHAQTVTTRVTFRVLLPDEAGAYAATGEGRDKAGAYAVQGLGAVFVERIEGSFTSVVGLPLSEVFVAMRRLGWIDGLGRAPCVNDVATPR